MTRQEPARCVAVLGTASDVGKSVVAAGLGRLLTLRGLRVRPFKALNMSNNSAVAEGGEIARAQAVQADACRVTPTVDMNPVLLKPESDRAAQLVVRGRAVGRAEAHRFLEDTTALAGVVRESLERVRRGCDVVVAEGAGSAAELNLWRDLGLSDGDPGDLPNWLVADAADARVLLVADIEQGGVFAQVLGTLDLLPEARRRRVAGVIVNRFRGDPSLFAGGVRLLEERAGVPVLGVLPWIEDLDLEEEDALGGTASGGSQGTHAEITVAVVLLRRMANFTDFARLAREPDVALRFAVSPRDLAGADVVILPGSKSVIADLRDLERRGMAEAVRRHEGVLVGVCGGFQMLGRSIADPEGVEGPPGDEAPGLGLLDVETRLEPDKIVARSERTCRLPFAEGIAVRGYEIHCGRTRGATGSRNAFEGDGGATADGRIFGTYLHGLFDEAPFRRAFLDHVRRRKGLEPLGLEVSRLVDRRIDAAFDRLADHLERHLDLWLLSAAIGVPLAQADRARTETSS